MRFAMTTAILIASMSVGSYAAGSFYNAQAAYGACQRDALQGLHYPINGDCPNWEAWKTQHVPVQTSPHRRVNPPSMSRRRLKQ